MRTHCGYLWEEHGGGGAKLGSKPLCFSPRLLLRRRGTIRPEDLEPSRNERKLNQARKKAFAYTGSLLLCGHLMEIIVLVLHNTLNDSEQRAPEKCGNVYCSGHKGTDTPSEGQMVMQDNVKTFFFPTERLKEGREVGIEPAIMITGDEVKTFLLGEFF